MPNYEYKVIELKPGGFWGNKLDAADIEVQLNQMGTEGWELINSMDISQYEGGTGELFFTFKRLKGI